MLGEGGMGFVLAARHQFTGAAVAVKLLHPELAVHGGRFLAEARAPASIGHPGIVQVTDAGQTPTGELYLVMELLQGRTLREVIEAGPVAPAHAQRMVLELLAALEAAHAAGFVHRDLKPENVFVTAPLGAVKLLDFGIAKVVAEGAAARGDGTGMGVMMGTLPYMAPEQIGDARGVDRRADLWAVGVMLHEMLCGRRPYHARNAMELVQAILSRPPVALAGVAPGVNEVIERSLAADPGGRWKSAGEMAAALAAVPMSTTMTVPPVPAASASMPVVAAVSTVPPTQAPRRTGRWIAVAAIAAGLAMGGVALAIAMSGGDEKTAAATPEDAPMPQPILEPTPTPSPTPDPTPIPIPSPSPSTSPRTSPRTSPSTSPRTSPRTSTKPSTSTSTKPSTSTSTSLTTSTTTPPVEKVTPVEKAPAEPKTDVEICSDGCKWLAGCGMAPPQCETRCLSDQGALRCIPAAKRSCSRYANCYLGAVCGGGGPSGSATCAATAQCELNCAGNLACGCGCVRQSSPRVAVPLLRLNGCAALCNFNEQCMANACQGFTADCARQ